MKLCIVLLIVGNTDNFVHLVGNQQCNFFKKNLLVEKNKQKLNLLSTAENGDYFPLVQQYQFRQVLLSFFKLFL